MPIPLIGAGVIAGGSLLAPLIGAGIIAGGSILASYISSEASSDASDTIASGATDARNELQETMSSYMSAGEQSLAEQQALMGLSGDAAQQSAISAIEGGSQFQALQQQGENAILQNASATGGLRGGNTQGALAQFRPALLNNLIDQRMGQLGNLTALGQNSAAGVGSQSASYISQSAQAQAQNALNQGQIGSNLIGDLAGVAGTFAGGGFGGFGSGTTSGTGSNYLSGVGTTGGYV